MYPATITDTNGPQVAQLAPVIAQATVQPPTTLPPPRNAEIQNRLEALKNPPKPVFKVLLLLPPPIDVEPATSSSTALRPTATSLPPTTPTSAMATTIIHTT
uniref:Uncharacterized protein n=1 Tax=Romanomermis culicivorax TaxID=13658 RepID=A0A915HZC2_ROMCU